MLLLQFFADLFHKVCGGTQDFRCHNGKQKTVDFHMAVHGVGKHTQGVGRSVELATRTDVRGVAWIVTFIRVGAQNVLPSL